MNLLFIENIPRTYPILHNAQKIKFSIEENLLQETADLVTFTGDMLNGKLHFLCSDIPFVERKVSKCFAYSFHV